MQGRGTSRAGAALPVRGKHFPCGEFVIAKRRKKILSLRADRQPLAVLPQTHVSLRDCVSNRGNPI
ncbi:MAG: hypothetical protein IKH45_06810 [Neisseriaceae bacterium]|nr:hypothetical protein [Neisseriaceae bacterium]